MNAWLQDSEPFRLLAGWTMIHFLWIGAVVALVGAAIRFALRRGSPSIRYTTSLITLTALAACPLAITVWVHEYSPAILAGRNEAAIALEAPTAAAPARRASAQDGAAIYLPQPVVIDLAHPSPGLPSQPLVASSLGAGKTREQSALPKSAQPSKAKSINSSPNRSAGTTALRSVAAGDRARLLPSLRGRGILEALAPHLPWLWMLGAPLTFGLLAAGLVGSERLCRTSTRITSGLVVETCERLRTAMRISRRVTIAVCDGVAQPVLVGIVRPLILLPASALTGWDAVELEMVLLHELAHVRRWDNLVNLVQRIVESLLFFHPAVWLVSRQVRRDREDCCDATVVKHTARPQEYAELLVSIASAASRLRLSGQVPSSLAAASAMADHPLAGRIRRILNLKDEPMWITRRILALTLATPLLLVAATLYAAGGEKSPPPSKGGARGGIETGEGAGDKKSKHAGPQLPGLGATEAGGEDAPARAAREAKAEDDAAGQSPFPSFEDQKIADRAYKLLGWELEPLTAEELAVVKQHGFEGGLRIEGSRYWRASLPVQEIPVYGDLLVGLHTFPIRNFTDLDELLNRDDLGELAPLKFYLLSRFLDQGNKDPWHAQQGEWKLMKGRIVVDANALRARELAKTEALHARDLAEAEQQHAQLEAIAASADAAPPAAPGQPSGDAVYLYDGKTFDQWRELWKNELKTERRTEALVALTAFGRAGYARQAAEAILDVAGEYGFQSDVGGVAVDQNPEAELTTHIVTALTSHFGTRLPETEWLPALMERLAKDPEKWQPLAHTLLKNLHRAVPVAKPQTINLLREMASDPKYGPNAVPLITLVRLLPEQDPEVENLIQQGLASEDAVNALNLLSGLSFTKIEERPEQLELLFHADAKTRQRARTILAQGNGRTGGENENIAEKLTAMLDDPEQAARHADAIRALAALARRPLAQGQNIDEYNRRTKTKIAERLKLILKEGDPGLIVPALAAAAEYKGHEPKDLAESLRAEASPERAAELKAAVEQAEAEREALIDYSYVQPHGFGGYGPGGGMF